VDTDTAAVLWAAVHIDSAVRLQLVEDTLHMPTEGDELAVADHMPVHMLSVVRPVVAVVRALDSRAADSNLGVRANVNGVLADSANVIDDALVISIDCDDDHAVESVNDCDDQSCRHVDHSYSHPGHPVYYQEMHQIRLHSDHRGPKLEWRYSNHHEMQQAQEHVEHHRPDHETHLQHHCADKSATAFGRSFD
jgi:hypothetical protein